MPHRIRFVTNARAVDQKFCFATIRRCRTTVHNTLSVGDADVCLSYDSVHNTLSVGDTDVCLSYDSVHNTLSVGDADVCQSYDSVHITLSVGDADVCLSYDSVHNTLSSGDAEVIAVVGQCRILARGLYKQDHLEDRQNVFRYGHGR